MTRKDYELIAAALHNARLDAATYPDGAGIGVTIAIKRVALALAADNPLFNHTRFLKACNA